jgi:hypothetical protein
MRLFTYGQSSIIIRKKARLPSSELSGGGSRIEAQASRPKACIAQQAEVIRDERHGG